MNSTRNPSAQSELRRRRIVRVIQVSLLAAAYFGITLAGKGWETNRFDDPRSIFGVGVASVSLLAVTLMEIFQRRRLPPKPRAAVARSRERWNRTLFISLNIGILTVGGGLLTEWLFTSISFEFILLPFIYLIATLAVYYLLGQRLVSPPWTVLAGFFVSLLSSPFSVLAYRDPSLLSNTFASFGMSVQVSRDISIGLLEWNQFALFLYSGLSLGHAWRSRLLSREDLGARDLQDLYELVLERNSTQSWADDFSAVFSETPRVLWFFQDGNFPAVLSLGWGMIERGLALVSRQNDVRARALNVGISGQEFDLCRDARNAMSHEGREPNCRDALRLLILVKHIFDNLTVKTWQTSQPV